MDCEQGPTRPSVRLVLGSRRPSRCLAPIVRSPLLAMPYFIRPIAATPDPVLKLVSPRAFTRCTRRGL